MELKHYKFNEELFDVLKGTDYEALKKDIQLNGIKTELHVLKDGTIICGNQRYRIAKELGIPKEDIPLKVVDIEGEDKIKEYVIKDNLLRRHLSIEQRAFLDYELYKMYYKGAGRPKISDNVSEINYDVYKKIALETGQSDRTIQREIAYVKAIENNPELKGKPMTLVLKHQKVAKEKEIRAKEIKGLKFEALHHGDALEELELIDDKSIDLCIIDPPYNIAFKSYSGADTNDFDDFIDIDKFEKIVKSIKRVLKPNAHFYCFAGFQKYPEFYRIIAENFEIRNILIWVKNNFTPTDFQYNYAHQYEMIIFATQGKRALNNVKVEDYGGYYLNEVKKETLGKSSDIIVFKNLVNKKHSAEKPVKLMEYLIANSSDEGEIVLDSFAGSGSTLVAAQNTNRNWIGIEKEKEFYEICVQRMKGGKENGTSKN